MAVVAHGQLDPLVPVVDRHLGALRVACVPQAVGQSFLDEPVCREVQSRRQLACRPRSPTPTPAGRRPGTSRPADRPGPARAAAPDRCPSSERRSTPTMRRISARASRPTASTVSRASRSTTCSGSSRRRTADACTVMTLTLWPMTSCSSRAIRLRSSATAWAARCSRLTRRCSTFSRLTRTSAPSSQAMMAGATQTSDAQRSTSVVVHRVEPAHATQSTTNQHQPTRTGATPAGSRPCTSR